MVILPMQKALNKKKQKLSIIIPVFNEAASIVRLWHKIVLVADQLDSEVEVIIVNDGSTDYSLSKILSLSAVRVINFRKNFGQTAALDAGIKTAMGQYIVTMDGDEQNDPADIPKLLKKLEEGNYDCVCGWRKERKDPFLKRFVSRGAHWLRNLLIHDGVHDSGCTLKIFKRECFDNIDLYGEMHRFIPALLKVRGYRIGEMVVKHHPRKHGRSKYNWKRTIKGGLDILALWFWGKYINRPLHFFGSLGLATFFLALILGFYAVYAKIFHQINLSSSVFVFGSIIGFFAGVQFFVFGLLMDMVVKSYYASKKVMNYEIAEIIDNK